MNRLTNAKGSVEAGWRTAEGLWDTLVEMSVVNCSPAILGGPRGLTIDPRSNRFEGLRPTSLRGVWRWWVRAITAGILWEAGYAPSYSDICKLERKMGLGSTDHATDYVLETDIIREQPKAQEAERDLPELLEQIPRYRLISMVRLPEPRADALPGHKRYLETLRSRGRRGAILFRRPIKAGDLGLKIRLRARLRRDRGYERVMVNALGMALLLGGIGQATSRGFGRFKPEFDTIRGEFSENLSYLVYNLLQGSTSEVKRAVFSLIDDEGLKNLLRRDAEELNIKKKGPHEIVPRIPSVHRACMRIEVVTPRTRHVREEAGYMVGEMVSAGEASLKSRWRRLYGLHRSKGKLLHTWPLGLPRGQAIKVRSQGGAKIMLGYYGETPELKAEFRKVGRGVLSLQLRRYVGKQNELVDKTMRMQSLIRIAVLSEKRFIIYGFKTEDLMRLWNVLVHVGTKPHVRPVDSDEVHIARVSEIGLIQTTRGVEESLNRTTGWTQVFDTAFSMVVKILRG